MIEVLKNLANLIKVKTIVTMVIIIVYAVLALRGSITPDNVVMVTATVIAFYFGTQLKEKPTHVPPEVNEYDRRQSDSVP